MIIHSVTHSYARKVIEVTILPEERKIYSDALLINLADNGGKGLECRNFGGYIRELPGRDRYEITVYTD